MDYVLTAEGISLSSSASSRWTTGFRLTLSGHRSYPNFYFLDDFTSSHHKDLPDDAVEEVLILIHGEADTRNQGGSDGRGQPTASPMLTAIMSGGVWISGREM